MGTRGLRGEGCIRGQYVRSMCHWRYTIIIAIRRMIVKSKYGALIFLLIFG